MTRPGDNKTDQEEEEEDDKEERVPPPPKAVSPPPPKLEDLPPPPLDVSNSSADSTVVQPKPKESIKSKGISKAAKERGES